MVAPHVDDSNRDEHFSVHHSLFGQTLHHAPRRQLVVFRMSELPGHGFEGFDETGEVRELVEGSGFIQSHGFGVVSLAEFDKGGREDRALEV